MAEEVKETVVDSEGMAKVVEAANTMRETASKLIDDTNKFIAVGRENGMDDIKFTRVMCKGEAMVHAIDTLLIEIFGPAQPEVPAETEAK